MEYCCGISARTVPLYLLFLTLWIIKVALLKLTPGQDRSAADFFLERNDALIIESFGVGGLPNTAGSMIVYKAG